MKNTGIKEKIDITLFIKTGQQLELKRIEEAIEVCEDYAQPDLLFLNSLKETKKNLLEEIKVTQTKLDQFRKDQLRKDLATTVKEEEKENPLSKRSNAVADVHKAEMEVTRLERELIGHAARKQALEEDIECNKKAIAGKEVALEIAGKTLADAIDVLWCVHLDVLNAQN